MHVGCIDNSKLCTHATLYGHQLCVFIVGLADELLLRRTNRFFCLGATPMIYTVFQKSSPFWFSQKLQLNQMLTNFNNIW